MSTIGSIGYISLVLSNARRISSQCNTRLRLVYLFIKVQPKIRHVCSVAAVIVIIITLFKSQIILAEHECSTNWGDCKSNKSNKSNQMLVFEERGKPEYPNSAHI